eukprot:s3100_g11.t1
MDEYVFRVKTTPTDPPAWVDALADQVEVVRLKLMGVMIQEELYNGDPVTSKLTTKNVHDWRLKPFGTEKWWLRRSRLVAREFVFMERRTDTFSRATSTHVMNVLPMIFLGKPAEQEARDGVAKPDDTTLDTVDRKDAFSMVDQPTPLRVQLPGGSYIVLKTLPGQHLGAKCRYWHFRSFLIEELNKERCNEQPCPCKNSECAFMVHVYGVMLCASTRYWRSLVRATE